MESNQTEQQQKAEVRISKALSVGENAAIASRKEVVKKGLDKLGIPCDVDKVPNIAVLASGGGSRAMIALYGTLVELKKYNLLDSVMYLGAVSGSTWCLSALYKDNDWAEKIEILEKQHCANIVHGQWEVKKATEAVLEATEDNCYSLTDFWSYFLVHKLLNQLDQTELSAHGESCENGRNPYPIYAAVDKESYLKHHEGTWFEFTPHEIGIPGLGAYIDTRHFGSVFENGQLVEKRKEKNICYLQGLWGSAVGSEEELLNNVTGALQNFLKRDRSEDSSLTDLEQEDQKFKSLLGGYQSVLDLKLSESLDGKGADEQFDHLESILEDSSQNSELVRQIRQTWSSADAETRKENYMRLCQAIDTYFGDFPDHTQQVFRTLLRKTFSCLLNWTWGTTHNFLYRCPGVEFPELTSKPIVSLIDAGLTINAGYPSVLFPERQVKLIISFDYSAGDPFLTIKNTVEYCKAYGIPFPRIDERDLQDTDNPSDCYIFRGENAPTVIHCPLFNNVNCPGKIAEYREQFSTFKMNYSEEEIDKLLTAAKTNVANIQQKILKEIERIVGSHSHEA
nr:cytosolic phospholipase A2 gamma-like isoform X1 [Pogona vitticeps]XP_020668974.1 cytosolic phospholipase A2 gamma-like isoform X1 [Pogona vitticeps]XP_020668975.1 cytosolic phospholipase A2 gamma-like isoform X1 [Pogona vitticeps]